MTHANEITKAIDDLVDQKTFSLDAVRAINDLREKVIRQEERMTLLCRERDTALNNGSELRIEVIRLRSELGNWRHRDDEMTQRETEATKALMQLEKYKAVAEAWKEAMAMVFRPASVRTEVHRNVAVPVTGSGNCAGFVTNMNESETTIASQE